MNTIIRIENKVYNINLLKPLDISIPLKASKRNVNAWYVEEPKMEAIMSVSKGDSTNFNTFTFNPHAHGTHTECVGHITKEQYNVNTCLKRFFFTAAVITVAPEKAGDDWIISKGQIQLFLKLKTPEALIIRTMPNTVDKLKKQYSNTNWPYLKRDAVEFLRRRGVKHLLYDQPSVDKEKDDGKLYAHKAFWDISGKTRKDCTITELIFVPNRVKDGPYILNLQVAPFENDAAPSRPVLYKLENDHDDDN